MNETREIRPEAKGVYRQFKKDMKRFGFKLREYSPNGWDPARPAVSADDDFELQSIIRATEVAVSWDQLGMGVIVYPSMRP